MSDVTEPAFPRIPGPPGRLEAIRKRYFRSPVQALVSVLGLGLLGWILWIVLDWAVFSAVFVRLFLSAHSNAARSVDVSRAVVAAENAAECFKSGAEPTLYYDDEWRAAKQADAAFHVTRDDDAAGGVVTETIAVETAKGETLYTLTVKKAGAVD